MNTYRGRHRDSLRVGYRILFFGMQSALPLYIKMNKHNFLELRTDFSVALIMIALMIVQLVLGAI